MMCVAADLADFLLRYSSQDGIELEVLSSSQKVIDSIKLRTIAHVLMHLVYFCVYTERREKTQEH